MDSGSLFKGSCRGAALMKWLVVAAVDGPLVFDGARVGEGASSRRGVSVLRGVFQVGEFDSGEPLLVWSLVGEESGEFGGFVGDVKALVGEVVGVVGRSVVDGDAGDSGRRKGEVRGEPNERGEGL